MSFADQEASRLQPVISDLQGEVQDFEHQEKLLLRIKAKLSQAASDDEFRTDLETEAY